MFKWLEHVSVQIRTGRDGSQGAGVHVRCQFRPQTTQGAVRPVRFPRALTQS